jgi:hypothetical protein
LEKPDGIERLQKCRKTATILGSLLFISLSNPGCPVKKAGSSYPYKISDGFMQIFSIFVRLVKE